MPADPPLRLFRVRPDWPPGSNVRLLAARAATRCALSILKPRVAAAARALRENAAAAEVRDGR